ncbi:MAG TPA: ABC transporter ATP-binding protein [Desulfobacteraceae bacterium]|nr:ABC transporter ATP-binding protein [Desulfobacteraceae bacterium]HPJ68082.1 ABC transporter ATP-binding protein [Desulfobacteraceae bacterium]HPQ28637.1 ABC transporter ATP-binding protein [Desulfobacteraceae bacterium]
MRDILRIENFSYAYPGAERYILRDVDMEIGPGECHCLTGPTGSGKTTLLMAIKGILPSGQQQGKIVCEGIKEDGSPSAGIVLQDPETQLLGSTVGSDVAFGLENQCVDPGLMTERVEAALSAVGLEKPLDFNVRRLSMGQKYRLILASLFVMKPELLLIDEPAAQLDPEGLSHLLELVLRLKSSGMAFIICEHNPEPFYKAIDTFWELDKEGSISRSSPRNAALSFRVSETKKLPEPDNCLPLIHAKDLLVEGQKGYPIWSDVSFDLGAGRRMAVWGPNGAGKTTLLRCLTGFLKPASGTVEMFGRRPEPKVLRGRLGCLFQNPQKQIFETTVFEEIAFPLKRLRTEERLLEKRIQNVLELCGIEDLVLASPHKLSYGQKHLVALASILAPEPELLILDDPFAGLDTAYCSRISELLVTLSQEQGTSVLWTVHNPSQVSNWADIILNAQGGRITLQ